MIVAFQTVYIFRARNSLYCRAEESYIVELETVYIVQREPCVIAKLEMVYIAELEAVYARVRNTFRYLSKHFSLSIRMNN